MDDVCLIINLCAELKQSTIQELLSQQNYNLKNKIVRNLEEAAEISKSNFIWAHCILCEDYNKQLDEILNWYKNHVACIPSLQLIICDNPSIDLIVNIFEYGLSNLDSFDGFPVSLGSLQEHVRNIISNHEGVEAKCMRLAQAINKSKHGDMEALEMELEEEANFHYLAAYYCAITLESEGKFDKSLAYFKLSEKLNPFFIPAQMGYSESLLLVGRVKESVRYLQQVDARNNLNPSRKLILANAYCELGDVENAKKFIEDAKNLGADQQKYIESEVHLFIASGKVGEALKLFNHLDEVGPHLASKLNDLGVSLSQAGKGKTALILYKKAHRIVRNDLKFKISLNAALACHRIGEFETARKYLKRCEIEFGGSFEKLEKIKKVVKSAILRQTGKDG